MSEQLRIKSSDSKCMFSDAFVSAFQTTCINDVKYSIPTRWAKSRRVLKEGAQRQVQAKPSIPHFMARLAIVSEKNGASLLLM